MAPLRERRADVVPLAEAFLERLAGRRVVVSPDAAEALEAHPWPGNVRELENVVERAVVLGGVGAVLHREDLPGDLAPSAAPPGPRRAAASAFPPAGVRLAEIEEEWIRAALRHTGGNRSQAARLLGVSRQALLYRMEKHGVDVPPAAP